MASHPTMGSSAFIARQTSIFAASVGNPPVLVVDVTASFPRPGGGTVLTGFNPSTDNGSIAFLVQGNGIYIATLRGLDNTCGPRWYAAA